MSKTRKSYFESAVNNTFHNSHEFWKVCKPFFSINSSISDSKILLVCNDNILNDDAEVASAFKSHFKEITKNLDISQWVPHPMCPIFSNPVYQAIAKYGNHPSIIKIRSLSSEPTQFTFSEVTPYFVQGLVLSLDTKKATSDSISPKLLKLTSDIRVLTL